MIEDLKKIKVGRVKGRGENRRVHIEGDLMLTDDACYYEPEEVEVIRVEADVRRKG